jgi:nucleoside-diphosphate-sugar epimerase
MHVFLTGGSGLTGPSIVTELIAHGHTVTGLARSEASAAKLAALGATPWKGSLDEPDRLTAGAAAAEGVIHMGFGGDFADPDDLIRRDVGAITALGTPLGADQPFVMTSGTFAMRAGSVSVETDAPDTEGIAYFRIPGEEACLATAAKGVRPSVVRLSPTVHGPGDYGFIAMLIAAARSAGFAGYVNDGSQRWPAVHREDAASLFRLALEQGNSQAFHGAGEEGVSLKSIAEKVADGLGIPARSLTPEEAQSYFPSPFLAVVFATDAPASNAMTRQALGWDPTHPTLLEDIEFGDYLTAAASAD